MGIVRFLNGGGFGAVLGWMGEWGWGDGWLVLGLFGGWNRVIVRWLSFIAMITT